jgi:hypothetical protein
VDGGKPEEDTDLVMGQGHLCAEGEGKAGMSVRVIVCCEGDRWTVQRLDHRSDNFYAEDDGLSQHQTVDLNRCVQSRRKALDHASPP